MSETITLWRPTGQAELDLVAASGWRKWPPRLPHQPIFYPVLTRDYATRIARQWNVPEGGFGYVTRFEVRASYIARHDVHDAGGRALQEYWIPAEELEEFNANIEGAIREVCAFEGQVPAEEFEGGSGPHRFPRAWRDYLARPSWFRRGWPSDDCYLRLLRPSESRDVASVYEEFAGFAGMVFLGSDGASENLVVDGRLEDSPVMLVSNVSDGWSEAIEQARTIADFVACVEDGSFKFVFDR